MRGTTAFADDYFSARERFRQAAHAAGAQSHACPIATRGPRDELLTIDVALLGDSQPDTTLVLSSGLHGVEGFAGSAVQCAWLASPSPRHLPKGLRMVLIHALNPWGFAFCRRVNEHNVDLNRNFLSEGEAYAGSPAEVQQLSDFIAPDSPPDPPWLAWRFWPQMALLLARHGARALRGALSQAQYDYPQGLFYGGSSPEETALLLRRHYGEWVGDAPRVLHLDLHTGLGRYGRCTLFFGRSEAESHWLERCFPGNDMHPADAGYGNRLRGEMGDDMAALLATRGQRLSIITAEFGTCSNLAGFRALREENRAARFPGAPASPAARRQLKESFCPGDPDWREAVVRGGLHVVSQAMAAADAGYD